VRSEEPLTRDQVEEKYGTVGGFRIPTLKTRGALLWIVMGLLLAGLALAGGLPGGGDRVNLREVLKPFPAAPAPNGPPPRGAAAVARDVQQTWKQLFKQAGVAFHPAKIGVFDRRGSSDCGVVVAASTDVYYCDYDEKLLVNAGIASPYEIAHGYAHHLQNVLKITAQVRRAERASPGQGRDFWLRHELQADCLAGVWAHTAYRNREGAGDEQAPVPLRADHFADSAAWNAPSRAERAQSFERGFRDGKPAACDTFSRDV
jgi:uncharacterized protein